MNLFVYLISILIFFIFIYKFCTNNLDYFQKWNIPFKKPIPLFGNMDQQVFGKEHRLVTITRLYHEFSKYRFFGYFEGRSPKFVIRDPELIKQITVTEFDSFNERITAFGKGGNPLIGKTLLGFTGEKWTSMRSTLSPTFTRAKLKQMYDLMPDPLEQMVQYLKKETSKGPIERDIKDMFTRFANDVIATTGYGIKVNSFEEEDNRFYKTGKHISTFTGVQLKLMQLGFVLFPALMKFFKLTVFSKSAEDFFHNLIINNIKEREEGNIVRPDMINSFMQVRKKASASKNHKENNKSSANSAKKTEWDDNVLASQGILFFLAGFETVSSTLCFICHELAENPDVQKKLQDEIDNAKQLYVNPSYDDIQQLNYLDMVIMETMRKWPASPVLDRVCTKSCFITDYEGRRVKIEKGIQIYFPTYAIHRDPQYFDDPEKFDPERFSDENKKNIKPFEYFPFGAGPRNCIGSRFALMEMKAILFHILAEFTFEVSPKTSVPITLSHKNPLMGPANGFWLEVKCRSRNLDIPFKKPIPLLGNIGKQIFGKQQRFLTITNLYHEFSQYRFFGYFEGTTSMFVIRDPELIKQITVTDFDSFNERATVFGKGGKPFLRKTLLGFKGEKWRNIRSSLGPTFTKAKIKQMYDLMPDPLEQMINYLKKETRKGLVEKEMKDLFRRLIIDVMATTELGIKVNSFEEDDSVFYKIAKDFTNFSGIKIKLIMLGFVLFPALMKMFNFSIFNKSSDDLFHELIINNIKEREKRNIVRPDIINSIMQLRKNALAQKNQKDVNRNSNNFTLKKTEWEDNVLAYQAVTFFLASILTVSSTLCFAFHELAQNPDVQKKLQDEIDNAKQLHVNPTYDDIEQLTYLDMVISETMRKWPESPIQDRVCTKSCYIENFDGRRVKIEEGTKIYLPAYAIQRDPQYFDDPDKFNPDRFCDANRRNINSFIYFPFGNGPRACIGSRFALMALKVILFNILAEFSFQVSAKIGVSITLSHRNALMESANGFWLQIKRRNNI